MAKQTKGVAVDLEDVGPLLDKVGRVVEVNAQVMDELANNSRTAGQGLVVVDKAARDAAPTVESLTQQVKELADELSTRPTSEGVLGTQIAIPTEQAKQAAEELVETAENANQQSTDSTKKAIEEITLDWDHYYDDLETKSKQLVDNLEAQNQAIQRSEGAIESGIQKRQTLEIGVGQTNQTNFDDKIQQNREINKSQKTNIDQLQSELIPTIKTTGTTFALASKTGIDGFDRLIGVLNRTAKAARDVQRAIQGAELASESAAKHTQHLSLIHI